ncbi:MAG: sulfurtransferase TusA family protein [Clostridiales bacterium]|nr:sulfurtransferase TusA family protein [Clostridiales bacterium]
MTIDTSGLSCPEPVLKTKQAIKNQPTSLEVIVDNNTALQNVKRFLENNKYTVNIEDYLIKAKK